MKGCVMVRGAARDEEFREVGLGVVRRYLSASVTALDFRQLCLGVTHPQPLSRGES